MALADADALYRSLPVTPLLFTSKYIAENKVDLYTLAEKITSEQNPLMEEDAYFYTDSAKRKYARWAKDNLQLWNNVMQALEDEDVKELLQTAKELQVL